MQKNECYSSLSRLNSRNHKKIILLKNAGCHTWKRSHKNRIEYSKNKDKLAYLKRDTVKYTKVRLNFCRVKVCRIQPSIIKADTFTNLRNWLSFQKIEEYLFIIPKYCPMTGSTNLHGDSQEISHQKKFDSHFIKSARQQLHAERAIYFFRVKLRQGERELHISPNVNARGYCIKKLSWLF